MRSRKIDMNNGAYFKIEHKKFSEKMAELFGNKPRINKAERALLLDAINNHNGEILEPANDDSKTMEVIVGLYDKGLVGIDFKRDKLFVSELERMMT